MFDLENQASTMSRVVSEVRDEQLADPTPCSNWTVADLLAHVHQFATVFTLNARKEPVQPAELPSALVDDWRTAIPTQLEALAEAWRHEGAWEGRASAGGVDMAAADNAVVAAEELAVHAWDLARATDQRLEVDDAVQERLEDFFGLFGEAPFGPAQQLAASAGWWDRALARTGRDPSWQSLSD